MSVLHDSSILITGGTGSFGKAFIKHALDELDPRRLVVFSRDELIDAIHGDDDPGIIDRTIDVHLGRLRRKLGDDANAPRYISTVRGMGFRFETGPARA